MQIWTANTSFPVLFSIQLVAHSFILSFFHLFLDSAIHSFSDSVICVSIQKQKSFYTVCVFFCSCVTSFAIDKDDKYLVSIDGVSLKIMSFI